MKKAKKEGKEFAIPAEVHTDCRHVKVEFDAVRYFRKATADTLAALYDSWWRQCWESDQIAEECPDFDIIVKHNEEVAEDFMHKDMHGFECTFDVNKMLVWLRKNRTDTYTELMTLRPELNEEEAEKGRGIVFRGHNVREI